MFLYHSCICILILTISNRWSSLSLWTLMCHLRCVGLFIYFHINCVIRLCFCLSHLAKLCLLKGTSHLITTFCVLSSKKPIPWNVSVLYPINSSSDFLSSFCLCTSYHQTFSNDLHLAFIHTTVQMGQILSYLKAVVET